MEKLTVRTGKLQEIFGSEVFEIVPNVNVGRDRELVSLIVDALSHIPNFCLLHFDCGFDADRTVITGVGSADGIYQAGLRLYEVVLRNASFSDYSGVHPSVGLVDVFPIVPIVSALPSEAQFAGACELTARLGAALGDKYMLPIYSYELSQKREYRRHLFQIRRGGLAGLRARAGTIPEVISAELFRRGMEDWSPDYGCYTENVTETGASVIGVRPLLLALNFTLGEDRLEMASRIAANIRSAGRGGMPGVRAIGWRLASRGVVQISVNIYDLRLNSLYDVYTRVVNEAKILGGEVIGTELIGCLPKSELLDVGLRVVSGKECSTFRGGKSLGIVDESQENYIMEHAIVYLQLEQGNELHGALHRTLYSANAGAVDSAFDIEHRLILGL